jgi:hypothetical protein
MEIRVEVGAAVLNDRQTEIGVGCFEQSGEDNAAGGDAVENQRVNVIGTEDHGEVGAGECTDAMLDDDNFAFLRRDDSGYRSQRFLKQFLMLRRRFNGAEENVSRTDLGESGTKADLDMDNGHAGGTRVIEDACDTSQEGVFVVFGVDGNDAGLLWETHGSRLPLRGVIRSWIGIGSLGNLDGTRRRSPSGCNRQIFIAGIAVIRQKRGYYAQGFDLRFHPRQLGFFQPENFVRILHESTPFRSLRSVRSLCAFNLDSGKNSNPKEGALPGRTSCCSTSGRRTNRLPVSQRL